MKRSAPPRPHVAKPHFIGQSPASFFMRRRCASLKKALAEASAFFWLPLLEHEILATLGTTPGSACRANNTSALRCATGQMGKFILTVTLVFLLIEKYTNQGDITPSIHLFCPVFHIPFMITNSNLLDQARCQ